MTGSDRYAVHIRVVGELSPTFASLFDDLAVSNAGDGTTVIAGEVVDEAAVHGLLARIRDLGLSLVTAETVVVSNASKIGDR